MGITPAVSVSATLGIVALLAWIIGRGRPKAYDGQSGTIAPERISAAFTVIGGAVMALGGAALLWAAVQESALSPSHLVTAIGLLLMGLAIGGFMSPSLTNIHSVSWTPAGLDGPSKLFGPTLGLKREALSWAELATTGKTATGYWYVESRDGRRIYWSYLYKGCRRLADALRSHCPELPLPPGMG